MFEHSLKRLKEWRQLCLSIVCPKNEAKVDFAQVCVVQLCQNVGQMVEETVALCAQFDEKRLCAGFEIIGSHFLN